MFKRDHAAQLKSLGEKSHGEKQLHLDTAIIFLVLKKIEKMIYF